MKRTAPMIVIASAVLALGQGAAFARPAPPANSNAQMNSNGQFATDRDFGRDRAEDRMSDKGALNSNSNGHGAADRDFGRDRAEDRMSAQGKAHAKAKTTAPKSKVALDKSKKQKPAA